MIRHVLTLLLLPFIGISQNYGYFAGGRSAAMAHSSVALSDVWSGLHNQAGLAFLEKPSFGLSYENRFFLNDLSLANAALAFPSKLGTVGLSLSYFGFELYNESKIGLNYSRKFGEYFSFGLQLNYHSFYVEEGNHDPGFLTFEAGILTKPIPKLSIGFHVFNPTNSYKNKETDQQIYPIMRLGALYQFNEEVALTGEIKKDINLPERYALGFEYYFIPELAFRTGVGIQPFTNTFGLGLDLGGFTADLSYEYAQTLGNNANISLQYEF
ncbi:hypothetical protein [Owenweeksia hongkongensis]|uniref:hypothetical protein n=1 Tax=Owenweeksia hongkongensis TaxID=253245 RepID=UPI003A947ABC